MKLKTKFQDEYFESGEVVDAFCYGEEDRIRVNAYANDNKNGESYNYYYNSIKDFTDHWEDAPEEPKKNYWYIDGDGETYQMGGIANITKSQMVNIGNYFESKEEAEKAVEKLKAFKRLKDKGFRFVGWQDSVSDNNPDMALFKLNEDAWETDTCNDLDLLFSGGEE